MLAHPSTSQSIGTHTAQSMFFSPIEYIPLRPYQYQNMDWYFHFFILAGVGCDPIVLTRRISVHNKPLFFFICVYHHAQLPLDFTHCSFHFGIKLKTYLTNLLPTANMQFSLPKTLILLNAATFITAAPSDILSRTQSSPCGLEPYGPLVTLCNVNVKSISHSIYHDC